MLTRHLGRAEQDGSGAPRNASRNAPTKRACIAICDPNQLFREGLQHVLRRSQFDVVTTAKTLAEVLDGAGGPQRVDMVIYGLHAGSDVGPQFAELTQNRCKAAGIRFVVLLHTPDRSLLCRAAVVGADAVLSMDISGDILQRSLSLVMLGQKLFPSLASASR